MSKSTIKRMCDSGALGAMRTPGGHRRIASSEIQRWAYQNEMSLRHDFTPEASPEKDLSSGEVLAHLARGEGRMLADRISKLVASGRSLAEILDNSVAPACWEIGSRWEKKELDPYEEHLRSRALADALTYLRGHLGDTYCPESLAPNSKLALGATLGGELHHLSSSMIELVLVHAGWQAISLGALLPVDSLVLALEQARPKIVWVSYTCINDVEGVVRDNHRLFSMLQPNQRLVVGGQALTREVRRKLKFDFAGDSLCHLSRFLEMQD